VDPSDVEERVDLIAPRSVDRSATVVSIRDPLTQEISRARNGMQETPAALTPMMGAAINA
jgi:hypothetical protein